jgi:hypothetical protein
MDRLVVGVRTRVRDFHRIRRAAEIAGEFCH